MTQNPTSTQSSEFVDAAAGSELEDIGESTTGQFEFGMEPAAAPPSEAKGHDGGGMEERDLPRAGSGGGMSGREGAHASRGLDYAGTAGHLEPQYRETPTANHYTVAEDDTLRSIAERCYGDPNQWHRIFEANQDKLANPEMLYPGQELAIP